MDEVTLWRYVSSAVAAPIIVPFVLLLIPWWRLSFRRMCWLAAGLEGLLLLLCWGIYALLGPTPLSVWLAGTLPPILCFCLFISFCSLRDGRFAFLMMTIGLDSTVCDSLASIVAERDEWLWVFLKVLILLIHGVFFYLFCRKPLLKMLESNHVHWGTVALLPLCLWGAVLGYYFTSVVLEQGKVPAVPTVCFFLTIVLIYVALYRFQKTIREQADIRQYNAILQSEVGFLQRQSRQAESVERSVAIFRHDMRHYIRLLRSCLETDDRKTAGELLARLEQNTEQFSAQSATRRYTGNAALDMVLNQAASRAKQEGLAFEVQLVLPQKLRVDLTELAVVLSNALENAVRAAAGAPDDRPRVVRIENLPCKQELFLVISNPFAGAIQWDGETGLPQSQEDGHGYGTLSIADFARRYHCMLNCVARDGIFYLRLLI